MSNLFAISLLLTRYSNSSITAMLQYAIWYRHDFVGFWNPNQNKPVSSKSIVFGRKIINWKGVLLLNRTDTYDLFTIFSSIDFYVR